MLYEADALPDDIAALKAMVLTSQAELAARKAGLRNRDLLIERYWITTTTIIKLVRNPA